MKQKYCVKSGTVRITCKKNYDIKKSREIFPMFVLILLFEKSNQPFAMHLFEDQVMLVNLIGQEKFLWEIRTKR